MKCPRCSSENETTSVTCFECGQRLVSGNHNPSFSVQTFGPAEIVSGQIVGDLYFNQPKPNLIRSVTLEDVKRITVGRKQLKLKTVQLAYFSYLVSVVGGFAAFVAFLANGAQLFMFLSSFPRFAFALVVLFLVAIPIILLSSVLPNLSACGGSVFFGREILKDQQGMLYIGKLSAKCSDCGSPLIFRSDLKDAGLYATCSAYPRSHGPRPVSVATFFT
jgi:hypothetical protein